MLYKTGEEKKRKTENETWLWNTQRTNKNIAVLKNSSHSKMKIYNSLKVYFPVKSLGADITIHKTKRNLCISTIKGYVVVLWKICSNRSSANMDYKK